MPIIKKDPVEHAVRKASTATNLFTKAKAELDAANGLLAAAVQEDLDRVQQLNERVAFAREQHDSNTRVANKLAEFTP